MNDAELQQLVALAAQYVAGGRSERAEDAYFEVDAVVARNAEVGWRLIEGIAARLHDAGSRAALGAGLLETFLRAHGDSLAEFLSDRLLGSAALLEALSAVNELAIPSRLKAQLPAGLP